MRHYGDVTKIKGSEVPKVDIITFGAPCQDLSVAGKRAGMKNVLMGDDETTRSGLFFEAIRIIKEMREDEKRNGRADVDIRPRYAVYENVPGAFTSNKGEDFRAVLEETAKIADESAVIPGPPGGKWQHSGCIMGNGWSIAWRVHDAQFWGVPQRRKRIALVADFGGATAPEILFERQSVSGDFTESGKPGKGVTTDAGAGTKETGRTIVLGGNGSRPSHRGDGYVEGEVSYTLNSIEQHAVCVEPTLIEMTSTKNTVAEDGISPTLTARMGTGGNQVHGGFVPVVSSESDGDIAGTLDASYYKGCGTRNGQERTVVALTTEITPKIGETDTAFFLRSRDYKDAQSVAYGLDRASFNQGANAKYNFSIDEEKIGAQVAKGLGAVCQSVVRRLTPMECERLQGFPDHWTDIGEWVDSAGKKHKDADAPRYKALGNSIALPFWEWMAERIARQYQTTKTITMASLFDGIGGFPLSFSRAGFTPVWASEIGEFPIAVTKIRFPDKNA